MKAKAKAKENPINPLLISVSPFSNRKNKSKKKMETFQRIREC